MPWWARRDVEPRGRADAASASRSDAVAPVAWCVLSSSFFPGMQPSPESYGRENLLLFDELVGRRLQYAQVLGDLRDFHEAVGRVVRLGCREGSTSPSLLPGILAAFRIFTDIPETSGNASRDIWRVSPFAGRPYRLSSCIWCSRFHLASKRCVFGRTNRDAAVGRRTCRATRSVGHAKVS